MSEPLRTPQSSQPPKRRFDYRRAIRSVVDTIGTVLDGGVEAWHATVRASLGVWSETVRFVKKLGRLVLRPVLLLRYHLFWEATNVVVFLFYIISFLSLFGLAWWADTQPYWSSVLSLSAKTSLKTSAVVLKFLEWSSTSLPLGVAVLSFSYSLVKDVSLGLTFSMNPRSKHLLGLFLGTFSLGGIQVVLSTSTDPSQDHLLGDWAYLLAFAIMMLVAAGYVREQLRRLTPLSEFNYCKREVERLVSNGLNLARQLNGARGVTHALQTAETHLETMFQVLGVLMSKDMDVFYADALKDTVDLTERFMTALHTTGLDSDPVQYRREAQFVVEKYFDHLALLSTKHHHYEMQQVVNSGFTILEQAAGADKLCLVPCLEPVKTALITILKRREEGALISILSRLDSLYERHRSAELTAGFIYTYQALIIESILMGDMMAINELLHRVRTLSGRLSGEESRWLYLALWGALLKSVEHSTHAATGAFLKTFVSRFNMSQAANTLQQVLTEFDRSRAGPRLTIPVALSKSPANTALQKSLTALNPAHDFIQGSLDYCLEKAFILWYGQQLYLTAHGVASPKKVFVPQDVSPMQGRYLKYLLCNPKESLQGYGLAWVGNGKFVEALREHIFGIWGRKVPSPDQLIIPKYRGPGRP